MTTLKIVSNDIFDEELLRDIIEDGLLDLSCDSFEDAVELFKLKYNQTNWCQRTDNIINLGINCLLRFIQNNFTGPIVEKSDINQFSKYKELILKNMVMDGESLDQCVKDMELLWVSRIVFEALHEVIESQIVRVWYIRSLFIHQQVLEETSLFLHNKISMTVDKLVYDNDPSLHLECARMYLYYGYIQKSKQEIEAAKKILGLETELIGSLGKRTKYQLTDLAQLKLKVTVDENTRSEPHEAVTSDLPTDLNLNDEVRLEKVKYVNGDDNECVELTVLHQAVLLAMFVQAKKSGPTDILSAEEQQTMLTTILDKPNDWSIQQSALLFRCKLESDNKRTVERSMMQAEILVNYINKKEPPGGDRTNNFFISHHPPRWTFETALADLLVSLGAIKSALDVYLRLQSWENVIACYNLLQLRHKAQEIIENKLKERETVKLWCLLGDATDDTSCYEKAWELSCRRSSVAQRHWAMYYYNRRMYKESVQHFQESLKINSLQLELWYRLGYAALHEEMWELSARAYRRYCALDSECFETWNNLARCYCELNDKKRAWKTLQEALKVNFSNWRLWDNYMIVSADVGEFDEVVRSYHQVLDLHEKHVDTSVLSVLVSGLNNIQKHLTPGNNEEQADFDKLRHKCLTLFGRVTSQVINNSDVWLLYSQIPEPDTQEGWQKRQQLLIKALRACVSTPGWQKEMEKCKKVVIIATQLVHVSTKLNTRQHYLTCKLNISGLLSLMKKEHPSETFYNELDQQMNVVVENIEQMTVT